MRASLLTATLASALSAIAAAGCTSSGGGGRVNLSGLTCGAGTHAAGSECLPDASLTCGAGTHAVGSECLPDSSLTCGPGTHASGTMCVPDSAGLTCGAGTHAAGSECVPDAVPMTCGPGTHAEGLRCVPDAAVTCGPGTHFDGSLACLADASPGAAYYDLRSAAAAIPADGYSAIPLLAIGRQADGLPAVDDVVVYSSRPWAGTFTPASFTLNAFGSRILFTPCSSATPNCTGPIQFTLAPASAPATVLAQTPVLQIEAPAGVGSAAPCLVGGNALYFDGANWVFSGTQIVQDGRWSAESSPESPTLVHVNVWPADPALGAWWDARFSTQQIGVPLAIQVYDGAMRWPFEAPGHPGLDVTGDGRGCNQITGRFEVQELTLSAGVLQSFTATFEEECDFTGLLRGCVHWQR
jgi:hypothetical protein